MRALLPATLAVLLVGCGGDKPRGVEVTEATDDARIATRSRPSQALDTTYADSGLFVDPRLDSLRLDSLRADSLRRDSLRRGAEAGPAAPSVPAADFTAFWPRFKAAVRAGLEPTMALAQFSPDFPREDFGTTFEAAFGDPFRSRVLALTPRDFRRDGTAREAMMTVGYDAEGEIVPQDEAETESAVIVRFDVVDGAYRLVSVQLAG